MRVFLEGEGNVLSPDYASYVNLYIYVKIHRTENSKKSILL